MFVDRARITVRSGNGGDGCVSFRKEKHVPKGGPDGGDGGDGGNVVITCDSRLETLLDFQYRSSFSAGSGQHGKGKNKNGRRGEDIVVRVPPGTVVADCASGARIADLIKDGESVVAAGGGRGGRGNASFKTSSNRAPRKAQAGGEGQQSQLLLELKLIADVGLVGCPNSGKSSFIRRVSNASPQIADYPFTTLEPQLGVVEYSPSFSFSVAEVPGLIEGAHEGKGLGNRFLRHVERTGVILNIVDLSVDPVRDFRIIKNELEARSFSPGMKKLTVAGNKTDIPGALENLRALEKEAGPLARVFGISCVTGDGIDELLKDLAQKVRENRNGNLPAGIY